MNIEAELCRVCWEEYQVEKFDPSSLASKQRSTCKDCRRALNAYYRAERGQGKRADYKPRKAVVGYDAAHERVRAAKGNARLYECPCGNQAAHWALVHEATETRVQEINGYALVYSLNVDEYQALCVRCHHFYDRGARA